MTLDKLLKICDTEAKINKLSEKDLNTLREYTTDQYNKKSKIITILNNIHYMVKDMIKK